MSESMETVIDRLVEYVAMGKDGVSAGAAAKALSLPESEVVELAESLAESGVLRVSYKISGVRILPGGAKRAEEKKQEATARDSLSKAQDDLKTARQLFQFSKKNIVPVLREARLLASAAEKAESTTPRNETRASLVQLLSAVNSFEEDVASLQEELKALRDELTNASKKLAEGGEKEKGSGVFGFFKLK